MLYGIKIKILFKIYKCIKTDWIWRYDLYPRSFSSSDKKGVNLIFFQKKKYLDFFYCHSSQYIPTDPKI